MACSASVTELDLRGTPCPLNYVRTKLALEGLAPGATLQVSLDCGEPEQMVSEGLLHAGHRVVIEPHPIDSGAVLLRVTVDG